MAKLQQSVGNQIISVEGARTHNLHNIDIALPRDKFIVITGISGSGKSSLAFDTIYAEGQRRYIESLSSYARQFLEQMPRPDCDRVAGLPPTVAIEQDPAGSGPQSTVATVTEIYDYLRLLFAKVATPHCPDCDSVIATQNLEQIVTELTSLPEKTRLTILAPLVRGRKGHYRELFEQLKQQGFVKARIDGHIRDLDDVDKLERYVIHDIDAVIDRLIVKNNDAVNSNRIADSVRMALNMGDGVCATLENDSESERIFNQKAACPDCNRGIPEPSPQMFSFNSPYGRCKTCKGKGVVDSFDVDLIVPDKEKSLEDGAVEPFQRWHGSTGRRMSKNLKELARNINADMTISFNELHPEIRAALIIGEGLKGKDKELYNMAVIPAMERLQKLTKSQRTINKLKRYISPVKCHDCGGARLREESLSFTVDGKNIYETTRMQIGSAADFFNQVSFKGTDAQIAAPVLKEIRTRLGFLLEVGLHYLTCDRLTGTLSTGESQRTRLATQIGSSLTGVCYILDEPSIGLHYRDHQKLLKALIRLRDAENSVLVVEHDAETIRCADWVLDLGPGAGTYGGRIIYNGEYAGLTQCSQSLTGRYMAGKCKIPVPKNRRRKKKKQSLRVFGAEEHNLKNIDVDFPLGLMTCITGVSGSGKSTLVNDILLKSLAREINGSSVKPGKHKKVQGVEKIDKVLIIDQAPIGKTSRSTPATYTKVLDHIRRVFAETKQAKVRGYEIGRFSYNNKEGRCEVCKGMGEKQIEMNLLPDMKILCEECHGRRFNEETLQITVQNQNIADVLDMTVEDALEFFRNYPAIERRLRTLRDVGLSYLKLGQPSNTLSGGEAQRIKLATELGKVSTGNTLYALDEPTTGLHFEDISSLLKTLHGLVDLGNTILIIEHNIDVIKNADYIIDLGPEGGEDGGKIIAEGPPEKIALCEVSHTGKALKNIFD